jgi:hypothetical protein
MQRWMKDGRELRLMACLAGCASVERRHRGGVRQPIPANSPLAKVQNGMMAQQVTDIRSADQPDELRIRKRWIPFYYGSDVRRTEGYKGLGRVVFTGGNQWAAAPARSNGSTTIPTKPASAQLIGVPTPEGPRRART